MVIVFDVSSVAQILDKTERGKQLLDLLFDAKIVYAPQIYISEFTNLMFKKVTSEKISKKVAEQLFNEGINYVDEFEDDFEIKQKAFELSLENKHPAYDMFYLALAISKNAILLTEDIKLKSICKEYGVTTI